MTDSLGEFERLCNLSCRDVNVKVKTDCKEKAYQTICYLSLELKITWLDNLNIRVLLTILDINAVEVLETAQSCESIILPLPCPKIGEFLGDLPGLAPLA